ncbi:hypothetical protein MKZ38_010146 [Zalerion maritima]|uniref:NAD-dependent epimerase/dehydratase domain-containing protein n=1 Tax=Zalerion maritima TaxID=339359 RepID=A0AAD5WM42_9PEZI|nr:hypothetical protein MKZ38_010146 [Zalerion maritima]
MTGASSFLGGHILAQLLERGYKVRGSVRSQEKADAIRRNYNAYSHKLEILVVEDISADVSLAKLMVDAVAVVHVASPVNLNPANNERDLLRPAIKGTLNVLRAAATNGSTIKRVILTSTMATMSQVGSGPIPGKIYSEADWNSVTWDQAVASPDGHYVYCASKTLAEQAAWRFMREENKAGSLGFDMVSIHPGWLLGPFVHHVERFSDLSMSLAECYETVTKRQERLPPTKVQYWTDVRDAARAHVEVLGLAKAEGRYLVANPAKFDWKKAFSILRSRFPDQYHNAPDEPGYTVQLRPEVDVSKAEKAFGFGWTSLDQSYTDMVEQFYKLRRDGMAD